MDSSNSKYHGHGLNENSESVLTAHVPSRNDGIRPLGKLGKRWPEPWCRQALGGDALGNGVQDSGRKREAGSSPRRPLLAADSFTLCPLSEVVKACSDEAGSLPDGPSAARPVAPATSLMQGDCSAVVDSLCLPVNSKSSRDACLSVQDGFGRPLCHQAGNSRGVLAVRWPPQTS
jgi:hypothetical protein